MKIEYKKVEELTPYENNPRNNDNSVEYVSNSIKEFGFKVPIIIDKNGVIVAGHTRLKAAKKLGMKEVPCITADDLTDEQIKAFRIADNRVGEASFWDMTKLDEELASITDIDMSDFGIEMFDSAFDMMEEIGMDTENYEQKKFYITLYFSMDDEEVVKDYIKQKDGREKLSAFIVEKCKEEQNGD